MVYGDRTTGLIYGLTRISFGMIGHGVIVGILTTVLGIGDTMIGILHVLGDGILGVTITMIGTTNLCLLYTSPSPRDATLSRMPSSA